MIARRDHRGEIPGREPLPRIFQSRRGPGPEENYFARIARRSVAVKRGKVRFRHSHHVPRLPHFKVARQAARLLGCFHHAFQLLFLSQRLKLGKRQRRFLPSRLMLNSAIETRLAAGSPLSVGSPLAARNRSSRPAARTPRLAELVRHFIRYQPAEHHPANR